MARRAAGADMLGVAATVRSQDGEARRQAPESTSFPIENGSRDLTVATTLISGVFHNRKARARQGKRGPEVQMYSGLNGPSCHPPKKKARSRKICRRSRRKHRWKN